MRKLISLGFIDTIISFLFFYKIEVPFVLYLGVAIPLFLFALSNYKLRTNKEFYSSFLLALLINLSVYLFKSWCDGFRPCFDTIDICFIIYSSFIGVFFIISLFQKKIKNSFTPLESKYPERTYDLQRLVDYIENHNQVGLNGSWGNGKTYLYNLLKQEKNAKYFFIEVSVMSVTIDFVEKFIVNEINNILEQNRIFSKSSSKLKHFLNQSFFPNLGDFFTESNSYTELIDDLKNDIKKLSKPILINFEDIDRIKDEEVIYKIFNISEKIAGEKIKILYLYEEEKLLKLLDVEKLYLEKYIPYVVELTPLSFQRIVQVSLNNLGLKNVEFKDFDFLTLSFYTPSELKENLGISLKFDFEIKYFSIRKIETFLKEVDEAVENDAFKELSDYKEKIILFFVIKHFMYDLYNKIDPESYFSDENIIEYKENHYSISDFFLKFKNKEFGDSDIQSILQEQNNRDYLCLLILFKFEFSCFTPPAEEDRIKQIIFEDIKNIKKKQTNEKINRLIRNLYWNGKSEYTDYEKAAQLMNELVLNVPIEKQEAGYKNFCEILFHQNFKKKDNSTIMRLGIPSEFPIFEAFNIYENDEKQWIKLLDFIFAHEKIDSITSELIVSLNKCLYTNKNVYLHILKLFNELKIIGNFNKNKSYKIFLKNYFSVLSGFCDTRFIRFINNEKSDTELNKQFMTTEHLPNCILELTDLQNTIPFITEMNNDIEIIKKFIEKNVEIINSEEELKEYNPTPNSKISIVSSLSKILEELRKEKFTDLQLKNELINGYKTGKYSPYEVQYIWENYFEAEDKKNETCGG